MSGNSTPLVTTRINRTVCCGALLNDIGDVFSLLRLLHGIGGAFLEALLVFVGILAVRVTLIVRRGWCGANLNGEAVINTLLVILPDIFLGFLDIRVVLVVARLQASVILGTLCKVMRGRV
jgi:hypothetical protein